MLVLVLSLVYVEKVFPGVAQNEVSAEAIQNKKTNISLIAC